MTRISKDLAVFTGFLLLAHCSGKCVVFTKVLVWDFTAINKSMLPNPLERFTDFAFWLSAAEDKNQLIGIFF